MLKTINASPKELSTQFAHFFARKDADAIGTLLADDFALFDPKLNWVRGKKNVVDLLKKQFQETSRVVYEVLHAYEEANIGILEFKIVLDDLTLNGVDFMHWENGKMTQLRCYYNPPHTLQHASLKPFSVQAQSLVKEAIYEHYSGKRYRALFVGRHSESLEEYVIYQAMYGEKDVWIRPLSMFLESVVLEGKTIPRFKIIDDTT